MNSYLLPLFISRLCSSRARWPVLPITVVLGWLENLNFFVEIVRWIYWISQVQSTGLPSIFLRAQPCISYRRCGEKLIKYQANSSWVIMSIILMTTLFYKVLIRLLQGEIWCWSLLGLKGLTVPVKLALPQLLLYNFSESLLLKGIWAGGRPLITQMVNLPSSRPAQLSDIPATWNRACSINRQNFTSQDTLLSKCAPLSDFYQFAPLIVGQTAPLMNHWALFSVLRATDIKFLLTDTMFSFYNQEKMVWE